jgi:hypothetical protein
MAVPLPTLFGPVDGFDLILGEFKSIGEDDDTSPRRHVLY